MTEGESTAADARERELRHDDPDSLPLHRIHVDAGASFTDFAGWQMPVRYTSDLAEHHAVRTAAGIFDISHMAEFSVGGPDAAAFLDYALAGQLSAIPLQRAKYSLCSMPGGGVIDDLIVYHHADGEYFVVANAGTGSRGHRARASARTGSTPSSPTSPTTSRSSRCRVRERSTILEADRGSRGRRRRLEDAQVLRVA